MAFQEHGFDRLRAAVEKNVEQAARVAARIRREPELELIAPVPLNVVTFRYRGRRLSEAQLDALNAEGGDAHPGVRGGGALDDPVAGRTVIRLAIVNHRSVDQDFEVLVDAVVETGRVVAAETLAE
jgi:glutamate/tyrosine decarboxylase-like PLP-dependent enzyme